MHVGVFLQLSLIRSARCRLPHARGGVSMQRVGFLQSPSLPHARGGVS